MKKVLFVLLLVLLCSSVSVSAVIDWNNTNEVQAFYTYVKINTTHLKDWSVNSNHAERTNADTITADYIDYDGTFYYTSDRVTNMSTGGSYHTVCGWYELHTADLGIYNIILTIEPTGVGKQLQLYSTTTSFIVLSNAGGGGSYLLATSVVGGFGSGKNFVCGSIGGSEARLYINASNEVNDLAGTNDFVNDFINLGTFEGGGNIADNFKVYSIMLFNKNLSTVEMTDLYNQGSSYNPYDSAPAPSSNFEITAKNFWNSSSINIFNVTLDNGSIYTTTNGTVIFNILQNSTSLWNFTVNSSGYFSNVTLDYNVSSNLEDVLIQTDITMNFLFSTGDIVNSTSINLTEISSSIYTNVTGGSTNIFPNSGVTEFRVTCDNNVFAPFNVSFNFSALENSTYNLTVNETLNVLTFLNAVDSSVIVNASINVTYPSNNTVLLTTNSSGQVNFSYIYNNVVEYGTYKFNVNKPGFILINLSDTINASNIPFSKTYNISRANLTINIYDRETGTLLSGVNVSVALVEYFNVTTDTGTLYKDNLSIISGEYILYVFASGYRTEIKRFIYTNQEVLEIDFYLLNLTSANYGNLFVSTTDSFFREITNATCDLLEYVPDSLSFVSISQCITNINAECGYGIELNFKTYYIRCVSVIGGEVFIAETNQEGEIITTTNEIRNLIFFTRADFSISSISNLIYSITESFINNVSSISVEFSTSDGTNSEVCIEYFKRDGAVYTSVTGDTYCLITNSAVQNVDATVTLNRSNDYEAQVYIKLPSSNQVLKSYSYPSSTSTGEIFDDDTIGAIILITWVFALGFCLHAKNITLFGFLAIVISWVEVLVFPIYSVVAISVFKTVMGVILIYVARKKKDVL